VLKARELTNSDNGNPPASKPLLHVGLQLQYHTEESSNKMWNTLEYNHQVDAHLDS